MDKQPEGLTINCDGNNYFQIDASERFMMVLKINGQWIASLHAHEACYL